ncbi:sucrose phosphorylase [Ideonella sp. BN130291]|uniref:sucrose phosphorylase n=1 Tax=Ideonella sp. BN130291 TaxID=3112940 RepID=UPI002E2622E0|nr:sucrose phosphorylase [Ideonella sp. BN130291]
MKNQVQLITYVDRLPGGTFTALQALLKGPLQGLFGGVHLLPFFDRIDGADAGFDPIDHLRVDPRLGSWEDVAELGRKVDLMVDVIVNHVSSHSPQFSDYLAHGAESPYAGMFLTLRSVFPHGATERNLLDIYRPRPGLPFTSFTLHSGERRLLWTTFTGEQIDIDVHHPAGRQYLSDILATLSRSGVRMVRLDAVGYAVKKAGTSCFMLPETFDFIAELSAEATSLGIEVLVEIHSHHRTQIKVAGRVGWVYDFALPPLLLHALAFGTAVPLKRWIAMRPTNAITVLDTHDGIGIIDIGADRSVTPARPGLVPDDELDQLVEHIHQASGGQSRLATGAAASNLDLYQVNCTYYDALGRKDVDYLIARAVQFFLPGVPQVYYVGLLAGENDMVLLGRTGVGRDINRQRFDAAAFDTALAKPVVRQLFDLIRLRNTHPAFAGTFKLHETGDNALHLSWSSKDAQIELVVDLRTRAHGIRSRLPGAEEQLIRFGA